MITKTGKPDNSKKESNKGRPKIAEHSEMHATPKVLYISNSILKNDVKPLNLSRVTSGISMLFLFNWQPQDQGSRRDNNLYKPTYSLNVLNESESDIKPCI